MNMVTKLCIEGYDVYLARDYDALDTELRLAISARDYANDMLDKERARIATLEKALTMLYDKWENGDGCYEDPETYGGFLGNAFTQQAHFQLLRDKCLYGVLPGFKLSQEEENQVLALICSGLESLTKDRCPNWPCALPAEHHGPCSTSKTGAKSDDA
jgi:hypothetical protein